MEIILTVATIVTAASIAAMAIDSHKTSKAVQKREDAWRKFGEAIHKLVDDSEKKKRHHKSKAGKAK